jgi:hypothetical protein
MEPTYDTYKNYPRIDSGLTTTTGSGTGGMVGGDYTYQGPATYSRKQPRVEEEVVDETVEEWEEEREDGTKVVVRKRTKRTKTTTTRDLAEAGAGGDGWTTNDFHITHTPGVGGSDTHLIRDLMNDQPYDLDTYSNKPFTTE